MSKHRKLSAFLIDGSISRDVKAYAKNDLTISDKFKWMVEPMPPTRIYKWRKEGLLPKYSGDEYVITSTPAPPEYSPVILDQLSRIWEDGCEGLSSLGGLVSAQLKLQLFAAGAGLAVFGLVFGIWLAVSMTYGLPELPPSILPATLEEAPRQ